MTDREMNPQLREQVQGVRGGIIGNLDTAGELPERFAQLAAEESNQVTFLDTHTGREVTVGLCDARGVRKTLAAFFS